MSGWPKVFRDPVHDVIQLDDNPIDRLIFSLINTREMQRLRRIKQLGFSNLVYPGANHSRLSHSIGVMHIARRMLAVLDKKHPGEFGEHERLLITVMALLHDIGHGPFSHAFEKVTGTKHERWTEQIIRDNSTEVNAVLSAYDRTLPEQIAEMFNESAWHEQSGRIQVLTGVVSSQLDADRMDYLLRDSMMTGSRLGHIDLSWLVRCMDVDFDSAKTLYLDSKGLQVAESNILARYHMFNSVYFHKTTRAPEVMLRSLLDALRDKLEEGRDWQALAPGATVNLERMIRRDLELDIYLTLDDGSIWELIKQCCLSPDGTVRKLGCGLADRRLLKSIKIRTEDTADFLRVHEEAKEILRKAGYDHRYFMLEDKPGDNPFKVFDKVSDPEVKNIYVEHDGKIRSLREVSRPVAALEPYKYNRWYFPAECREAIDNLSKHGYS